MVQSEQIICKVAFWYYRRMALMFLLLTGGGAWFYYDGLINWPDKNKIYLAKVALKLVQKKGSGMISQEKLKNMTRYY